MYVWSPFGSLLFVMASAPGSDARLNTSSTKLTECAARDGGPANAHCGTIPNQPRTKSAPISGYLSPLGCCLGMFFASSLPPACVLIRNKRRHQTNEKREQRKRSPSKTNLNSHSRTVRTQNGQRTLIIGRLRRPCVWPDDIDRWLWMLIG